jgi:DNA-binding PadR family transcriptional regulator
VGQETLYHAQGEVPACATWDRPGIRITGPRAICRSVAQLLSLACTKSTGWKVGPKAVSAKHAVLGLVIEQPSYAYRIASGVRRQLRFADLADSYPYWALEKLETEGLVRRVDEKGEPLRNGAPGRRAIYEATAKGVASFEDWLLSTTAEPPLRDDLHFRIALCRPRDAPRMIELIHGQELVCLGRVQDLKRASEAGIAQVSEWDRVVSVISRDAELAFWNARIEWLQEVREMLEGLPDEVASTAARHTKMVDLLEHTRSA